MGKGGGGGGWSSKGKGDKRASSSTAAGTLESRNAGRGRSIQGEKKFWKVRLRRGGGEGPFGGLGGVITGLLRLALREEGDVAGGFGKRAKTKKREFVLGKTEVTIPK